MPRKARKPEKTLGQKIFRLALLNSIPLAGLAALAWALATERVSIDDLPPGVGRPALGFVVALLVLIIVVSALLPLTHAVVKTLWRQLKLSALKREEGGVFRALFEFAMWPFRRVLHLLFWCLRFGWYLVSLGLILSCCLFLVRTIEPGLWYEWLPLEDWGEEGLEWIRARYRESRSG